MSKNDIKKANILIFNFSLTLKDQGGIKCN